MKPYYEQDGITIYHGDCREILPQLEMESVDLVLTDPPYGIEGGRGHINKLRGKGTYSGLFDDTPEYLAETIVPVMEELISHITTVVVTPGSRNMHMYPQPDSFGVFYQPAAVGLQRFGNMDSQPIFYYGRNPNPNMGCPCSYQLTETPETNGHPCPKPLKIWKLLLSNVSVRGALILDPFMGSGTTLRAAKDLGRKSIGIEISEEYCEIAVKRMAQEVLPLFT